MSKGGRGFRVELLTLGVITMGVFLQIDWSPTLSVVDQAVVGVFRQLTPAMLIGAVLVVGVSVFIVWRVRVRFFSSAHWRATACPRCGSPIHRVHRSLLDKVVSKVFLPHARRYRCEKAECGWSGLRHSRRTMNNEKLW
jgi:predicted RNA-binding Zn-ribbon protein involved in translation (DUF1610 family)